MADNRSTSTAKVGPGLQATAVTLTNLRSMHIDFIKRVATFEQDNGATREFEIVGSTSVNCAISGANHTVTIT